MIKPPEPFQPDSLVSYATLCQNIKPGDVVAFSGSDLPSTVVKVATQSSYVHVAIVLSVQQNSNFEETVLIAESHIDTSLPSLGTGKRILGVQFQWLFQRVASCPGPIWWAALQNPLHDKAIARMQTWLREIEQQQVPYDFVQAVEVGLDSLTDGELKTSRDYSALFCSELVTRALQIAGAIDETINPSGQTPAAVMQFPCWQEPVLIKK